MSRFVATPILDDLSRIRSVEIYDRFWQCETANETHESITEELYVGYANVQVLGRGRRVGGRDL